MATDSDGKVYTVVDSKRVVGGDGAYMPADFIAGDKEYNAPESSSGKIDPKQMNSMSDAKAMLATERDIRNQEVPETSGAAE